jgi:hypothetical protein
MFFEAVLAVAQLSALSVFPLFRKKFSRKQLYTGSMIAVTVPARAAELIALTPDPAIRILIYHGNIVK